MPQISEKSSAAQTRGERGEELAVDYLRRQGYVIVARNYRTRLGELDIIAREHKVLCFIEVKTRRGHACGFPSEAVHRAKQRKLSQMALWYLKEQYGGVAPPARFDVVEIQVDQQDRPAAIQLFRNAFELAAEYFT